MNTQKKISTRQILYRIGLVLSGLIIAALGLLSLATFPLCGFGDPIYFRACLAQYLAILGSLAIILIAACLVAKKYPFFSGAVLIIIGMVPVVILFLTSVTYLLPLGVPFFIVGLLFLSMGCFDQAAIPNMKLSVD